ncbi:PPOX class F420-dependent oxidoreductase [Actinoallomurus sp. CA-150999]|uniref:PPOX class F420-dependent oxidoreductase n=1 Tax=Actinoallomurus sp. CA-150999 TaxID=3239887 RepID=UPI003D8F3023
MAEFSVAQRVYLSEQRLGRLATVDPTGQPQNNPVMFSLQDDGTILIGGHNMGASKKWRNLQANPKLSFVVDDVVSFRPWRARFVEIRGTAELLEGTTVLGAGFSSEVIRIHPEKIFSFGVDQ